MTEIYDNRNMNGSAAMPLTRTLKAPFTRRAWAEVAYAIVSLPLAVLSFGFTLVMMDNTITCGLSTPPVRMIGAANRFLAWRLLGERVPPPAPMMPQPVVHMWTNDTERLTKAMEAAGGRVRQWVFQNGDGISVRLLSRAQIAEVATAEGIGISRVRVGGPRMAWFRGAILDKPGWRARIYIAAKLPLATIGVAVAACYLVGLYWVTLPAWQALGGAPGVSPNASFVYIPFGAAFFLAAPWLMRGVTEPDRWLVRNLLGPTWVGERVRELEETRTIAVDDAAARLRGIERDLHDGAQAQLVALSMKLGLAKEKLTDAESVDLGRITQLVEDAHRAALEAIMELRTLARGIHPPVLDKGLADALTTLANRSVIPVEVVMDVSERPSAAIETIAYFSAAELLANVAKHSGARHATLEAVHVPGLLRIRVTDDGRGGVRPTPDGGLRGLAERVRTVDGQLEIDSPAGGPTTVTVELPSHA
jgi:signal transduction histidine kinase